MSFELFNTERSIKDGGSVEPKTGRITSNCPGANAGPFGVRSRVVLSPLILTVTRRERHLLSETAVAEGSPDHDSPTGWSSSGISTTSPHSNQMSREQSPEF